MSQRKIHNTGRNRWAGLVVLACAISVPLFGSLSDGQAGEPAKPRLGMNLSSPEDWNTELPFVDAFRLSRAWISQRRGAGWGEGPKLELDQHGWVRRLQPGCYAETLLCTIEGGHYPSGQYTVLYEGRGRITFGGAASIVSQKPGRMVIDVDAKQGTIFLRVEETDPSDYMRNIRVIMPGFEETYRENPFHPDFLNRWKGIACFRFMDWMKTNNSEIQSWTDRPRPDDATFTVRGVPLEIMIDLCNHLDADAWFCMPHQADDDFVRRFATMVHERLEADRKVYIEYSNEVWNSIFAQNKYAQAQGRQLGLGPAERPWEGGGMYYASRSVEIFRIWSEVFGETDQLIRVLAWQSGSVWWLENIILPHQQSHKHADALALAPYMGMNIPANGQKLTAGEVAGWSVDRVLDHVEQKSLTDAIKAMRDTKTVADKYGLTMITYEGGQHLVGVAGGDNSEPLTKLLHQANGHPRMGRIYDRYLAAWADAGGGLFCHFTSIGRWSKHGSWGVMQYADDDPNKSPKFLSLMRWAKSIGQPVKVPR